MGTDYQFFIEKVKNKTGINISFYKDRQMKRRLASLCAKHGYQTFHDFYRAIERDKGLLDLLLSHMTINVTEFYRNKREWDTLEKLIVPDFTQRLDNLKVWSAACSTGEEPYSLAILLSKFYEEDNISITATDIDNVILKRAKQGRYTKRSLKVLSEYDIKKYFQNSDDSFEVSPVIKKLITFQQHDLTADTYKKGYDLIVCRNVLIYFTQEAQSEIIKRFSKSLKNGGVLFIGSTERINNPQQFGLKSISSFFFRKV